MALLTAVGKVSLSGSEHETNLHLELAREVLGPRINK